MNVDERARYEAAMRAVLERCGSRAESRVVALKRLAMRAHVLVEGAGPPVVLVHGGGGNASNWAPLLPRLARSYTVYALDRPGCGLSDGFDYRGVDLLDHGATFLDEAFDALGLDCAALVGNSMGGLFGASFADRFPERVSRLAFVGSPAGAARGTPLPLRLMATPGVGRLLLATAGKPSESQMRGTLRRLLVARPERVTREMIEAMWRGAAIPEARVAWRTMLANCNGPTGFRADYLLGPALARLAVPALFLWGERDRYVPTHVGRALAATMPNAAFVALAGAGHLAWLDDPHRVHAELEAFLARGAGATAAPR